MNNKNKETEPPKYYKVIAKNARPICQRFETEFEAILFAKSITGKVLVSYDEYGKPVKYLYCRDK